MHNKNSNYIFTGCCGFEPEVLDTLMRRKADELAKENKEFTPEMMEQYVETLQKIKDCEVNFTKQYAPNEFLFAVDNVPFLTRADIHTIGAKQKGGKTSVIRILIAAAISGQWHRVSCLKPDMKIVYLDTEQKAVDTQNSLKMVMKMAGKEEVDNQNIHMFNFRPLTPDEMMTGIVMYLIVYRPDMLVIDGIVDICKDFNDVEASQNLVLNFLMKLAEEFNCAIVSVLHTNKTDKYTELRGHLGAFLEQKGVSVIKCIKDEGSNIVSVTMPTVRYAPVPDWHFTFDAEGLPVDAEEQFKLVQSEIAKQERERKEAERQAEKRKRKDMILDIISTVGGTAYRKDVYERFHKIANLGETVFKDLVKEMIEGEPHELYQSGPKNKLTLSTRSPETIPGL